MYYSMFTQFLALHGFYYTMLSLRIQSFLLTYII